MAGAAEYALRKRLHGFQMIICVPLLPMSFAGVYAAIGWPAWASLNSDWPLAVAHLCGLATFAMGALIVTILADTLCVPGPKAPVAELTDPTEKVSVH